MKHKLSPRERVMISSTIDLREGDPVFLFDYWRDIDLPRLDVYYPGLYPSPLNDNLRDVILKTHTKHCNITIPEKCNIVYGNGATQLLAAAFATSQQGVKLTAPHYHKYTEILDSTPKTGGLFSFTKETVATIPNNPTGDISQVESKGTIIYDLSYNWKTYNTPVNVELGPSDIAIFSLAKATGHASTRLGWAFVPDNKRANAMQKYINSTSLGVSVASQEVARFILQRDLNCADGEGVFDKGEELLKARWELVNSIRENLPFEVLNNNGMFLWCKGEMPKGLIGIPGSHFGSNDKHFRLSIGCDAVKLISFIGRYKHGSKLPSVQNM